MDARPTGSTGPSLAPMTLVPKSPLPPAVALPRAALRLPRSGGRRGCPGKPEAQGANSARRPCSPPSSLLPPSGPASRGASGPAPGPAPRLHAVRGTPRPGKPSYHNRTCPGPAAPGPGGQRQETPSPAATPPPSGAPRRPGGRCGARRARKLGGAARSPSELWPRSPAERSLLGAPAPPPSWSLFNDAPSGAFWERRRSQPIGARPAPLPVSAAARLSWTGVTAHRTGTRAGRGGSGVAEQG